MTSTLFEGSALLLQGDLLHHESEDTVLDSELSEVNLDHLAASLRQAFAFHDGEGALLVIEVDDRDPDRPDELATVATIARSVIRKTDLLETLDSRTVAVALPGSGRIGMTRVADAIRQRVWAAGCSTEHVTTITIGAVHATEASLADLDDLLLAARVNLDAARAAGGNRTNWSDWAIA